MRFRPLNSLVHLLALAALAACAAPPTVAPTAILTPTSTALPATAIATPQATADRRNASVPATSVQLGGPSHIAFDSNNNAYISDCGRQRIYKIDTFGQLTVYAGTGGSGFSGDGGPALQADMGCPEGLAFDRDGNLYVTESHNNRVRRVDRNGIISTVAGSGPAAQPGSFAGDGGPASAARLWLPDDVAFDAEGNLYISDYGNQRIRKVDQAGIITTIAGTGTRGSSGDGGPATQATLNQIVSIAIDLQGNLYLSDRDAARVREIDQQGIITTIAGTGQPSVSGDGGPATAAALSQPEGLAFDAAGNLYIACGPSSTTSDARIRKVDGHGTITTAAGAGPIGFSGDGEQVLAATFNALDGIAFDRQGNLYIADTGNLRIRRVDQHGIIITVAGGAP